MKQKAKITGGRNLLPLMTKVVFGDSCAYKIVNKIHEYVNRELAYEFFVNNGLVGARLSSFVHKSYGDNIDNLMIDIVRLAKCEKGLYKHKVS